MVQPSIWVPVTVHGFGGLGVFRNGVAPHTATTFPLTTPPAAALLSNTFPFDQMSPVSNVVELPWNVSELPAAPPHPPGLRVWIAAPFVPVLRASAVAVAPMLIV